MENEMETGIILGLRGFRVIEGEYAARLSEYPTGPLSFWDLHSDSTSS